MKITREFHCSRLVLSPSPFFFFFFSFFFPSRALRHRERERLFRCSISANDADEDDVDGPSSPLYSSGTLGQKEKPSSNFSSRCIRSAGVSRPLACSNVIRGNRSWKDIVSTFLSFFFLCVCVSLPFPPETHFSRGNTLLLFLELLFLAPSLSDFLNECLYGISIHNIVKHRFVRRGCSFARTGTIFSIRFRELR